MRDAGYDDDICGGIIAACSIGPLVPPSIAMTIYGVIANESIAKLFITGSYSRCINYFSFNGNELLHPGAKRKRVIHEHQSERTTLQ